MKAKQGYDLYDWWRKRVGEVEGGHRYFYLMCLCIYATECDVPLKKLEQDMEEDFKILDIEKLSGLRIERNKRNGRKQEVHLYLARRKKEDMKIIGEEVNKGRPNKQEIVKNWKKIIRMKRKVNA